MYGDRLEDWAIDTYRAATHAWASINSAGLPVACAGLEEVRPGVLYCWGVGTEEMASKARDWMPYTRKRFDDTLKHTSAHRIECYVLKGFDSGERFIKRLGFEFEGEQRAAGGNREDALLFAKVKP
jgi:hypothetical protein